MAAKPLTVIEKLKYARRCGTPLVAWISPDPRHSLRQIADALPATTPIVSWDCGAGLVAVNEAGKGIVEQFGKMPGAALQILDVAPKMPDKTLLAILQANAHVSDKDDKDVERQMVWNLRDAYKQNHRTLLLMAQEYTIPKMLKDDVYRLDEPYPTLEEVTEIVRGTDKAKSTCPHCRGAKIENGLPCGHCEETGLRLDRPLMGEEDVQRAAEAVSGIPAFAAEQAVSMALREPGIDMDHAWTIKRAQIEQTKGLSVHRNLADFSCLGGMEHVKQYFRLLMTGPRRPRLVVWLDEIGCTALGSRMDTSGVNQDYEGTLLSWLEDHDVYGALLLGCPGTGKSQLCKAIGGEFDRIVIRLDLGAMMGQYVGQSQNNLRAALRVVEAVGGDETLWVGTANSIEGLSSAMRSRFVDTFMFDLPTDEELAVIWKVWLDRYAGKVKGKRVSDDIGWVGRNVRHCVEKAYRMGLTVEQAAKYITPVGVLERETIHFLRAKAHNRYLSIHHEGLYQSPESV